jgi:hypothetical protein
MRTKEMGTIITHHQLAVNKGIEEAENYLFTHLSMVKERVSRGQKR